MHEEATQKLADGKFHLSWGLTPRFQRRAEWSEACPLECVSGTCAKIVPFMRASTLADRDSPPAIRNREECEQKLERLQLLRFRESGDFV